MLTFFNSDAMAQPLKGEFGHFFIGNSFLQSRHLQLMDMEHIPSSNIMIGGGGYGTLQNILLGGEGGIFTANTFSTSFFGDVRQSSGFGLFKFGYITPLSEGTVFYPTVGIGGGGTILSLYDKSDDERTFFARQTIMNFELNFDVYLNLKQDRFNGFKAGFSIGYLVNPISKSWNEISGDGEDLSIPRAVTDGLYVRLTIGGGEVFKSEINRD